MASESPHQAHLLIEHDRIVRVKEACLITGRSVASIYRDEKLGLFPKRIRLGANAVGFKLSSLLEWLDSRPLVSSEGTSIAERSEKEVIAHLK